MLTRVIIATAFFLMGCSSGDSELGDLNVRRAVEIAGAGYEPKPGCIPKGSVSMPELDLSFLGSATGGAEVDFIHELSGKALRMGGNLVVPAAGVSAKTSASSGNAFSGDVYHCPR